MRYAFGYRFVRLARLLAALIAIGGIAAALVAVYLGGLAIERSAYKPAPGLPSDLENAWRVLQQTEAIVAVGSLNPLAPTRMHESELPRRISTSAELEEALTFLGGMATRSEELKATLLKPFIEPSNSIKMALADHSKQAAAAQAAINGNPDPFPAHETNPSPGGLFEKLSSMDREERQQDVTKAIEFLKVLTTISEKAESKESLGAAANAAEELKKFLRAWALVPQEAPIVANRTSAAPVPMPRAGQVALQLEQLQQLVRLAVTSDWHVDAVLSQLRATLNHEKNALDQATAIRHAAQITRAIYVSAILAGSALLFFLIFVVADLIQAILDTARSGVFVAERHGQEDFT